MKLIIAGGRGINEIRHVYDAMDKFFPSDFLPSTFSEIVSGCAYGADALGERFAAVQSIPIKRFPADWDRHGKPAGFIRNKEMAEYADALLLLWDGKSKGSENMLLEAARRGLRIYVYIVKTGLKNFINKERL